MTLVLVLDYRVYYNTGRYSLTKYTSVWKCKIFVYAININNLFGISSLYFLYAKQVVFFFQMGHLIYKHIFFRNPTYITVIVLYAFKPIFTIDQID